MCTRDARHPPVQPQRLEPLWVWSCGLCRPIGSPSTSAAGSRQSWHEQSGPALWFSRFLTRWQAPSGRFWAQEAKVARGVSDCEHQELRNATANSGSLETGSFGHTTLSNSAVCDCNGAAAVICHVYRHRNADKPALKRVRERHNREIEGVYPPTSSTCQGPNRHGTG